MKTFPNNLEEFQDLISSSQTIINTRRLGIPGVDSNQVQLEVVSVRSDENVTTSYVLVDPQDRKEYHPTMVKPEFFQWIKVNNPFADWSEVHDNLIPNVKGTNKIPVDFLFGEKEFDIVFMNYSGHMLKDREYKDIPYARKYDYIGSPFHNGAVDLDEKFLSWLRNHPWLVSNPEDVKVLEVPYYNSCEDHSQYVSVALCPDVETYREICDYYKDKEYPSCCVKDAICGQTSRYGSDTPDWFGIRPWLKC